jgi:hypothetical protein
VENARGQHGRRRGDVASELRRAERDWASAASCPRSPACSRTLCTRWAKTTRQSASAARANGLPPRTTPFRSGRRRGGKGGRAPSRGAVRAEGQRRRLGEGPHLLVNLFPGPKPRLTAASVWQWRRAPLRLYVSTSSERGGGYLGCGRCCSGTRLATRSRRSARSPVSQRASRTQSPQRSNARLRGGVEQSHRLTPIPAVGGTPNRPGKTETGLA